MLDGAGTGGQGAGPIVGPVRGDCGKSTMRCIMRQQLFAWGDDFLIKDESGRDLFFVDGKAFSLGHQLSFQDMEGNELAFIRQKLLAWGPTYEIYGQGQL